MIVPCSNFIHDKIEDIQELIERLSLKFDQVSILGSDVAGVTLSISSKSSQVSDTSSKECGFVVRLLKEGHFFEYSFNEWDEIDTLVERIKEAYYENMELVNAGLLTYYDQLEISETMEFESLESDVKVTLDEISLDDIMDRLETLKQNIMEYDPRVLNVQIRINNVHVSKVFISNTKNLSQSYMYSDAIVVVTVKEEEKIQLDMQTASGLKGMEIVDEIEGLASKACINALELLKAKRMVPGVYDVICNPEVSGLIAHEAFGHGVEMDMFVKNRAKAKDYMGKQVASPLVTMVDGATGVRQVASYLFDDEGVLGTSTTLIKDGILQAGISDLASSCRLKTEPTGNGRRESYERKAYARMTNTYFEKGTSKVEDMIASVEYGFLLEGMFSGMEDPKHWGIQCIVAKAREIKNGQLTGDIYSPVILTGYVPTLLKSISMVSDQVELFGAGSCGKGYKEWVSVSDGGPYLKAKARLG